MSNRQQRRAAASKIRHVPELRDAEALATRAFEILRRNLGSFEPPSVLSPEHADALMRVTGGMAMLATGARRRTRPRSSQRIAYELDTGCGKTESAVALMVAIHELGLPLSVALAATKIEALVAIHDRLTANGVPAGDVALWHSKEVAPTEELLAAVKAGDPRARRRYVAMAATPAEALHQRPFLLCSHERIRRGGDISFNGKPRSLVVWDEALLTSSSMSVALDELSGLLAWLSEQQGAREEGNPLRSALAWLAQAKGSLTAEQSRQEREPASMALPIRLPPFGAAVEQIDDWAKAIETECRKPRAPDAQAALTLLDHGPSSPVRVAKALKERAVISIDLTVPDSLRPMAILDASYPIRELERLDRTIEPDEWFQGRHLKSYSRVRGHLWRTASGRGALERALESTTTEPARLLTEIVHVVAGEIPSTEAVLFFTHLPRRRVNVAEKLKEALCERGVDPTATLPDGRPRFGWLTFGSEASSNDFSRTENVIFVGTHYRGDADVAAAIAAQRRDLLGPIESDEVTRVLRSETAHSLYQALSRGVERP